MLRPSRSGATMSKTDIVDCPSHWGHSLEGLARLAIIAAWEQRSQELLAKGKLRGDCLSDRQSAWMIKHQNRLALALLNDALREAEQGPLTAMQILTKAATPLCRRRGRPGPSLYERAVRNQQAASKAADASRKKHDRARWVARVLGIMFRVYCERTGYATALRGSSVFNLVGAPSDDPSGLRALTRAMSAEARKMQLTPNEYLLKQVKFDAAFAERYAKKSGERLAPITLKRRFQRLFDAHPFDLDRVGRRRKAPAPR